MVVRLTNLARDVALVHLQHGKANAIDATFLRALNQALDQAEGAFGLVLTGQGRFFSVGLDLREVFPLGRREMAAFMQEFIATLRRVLTWPGPTVAAINGHALGGGFLLALACDKRLVAEGTHARIGFPDVEKQVPLSHSLRLMALHVLPRGEADLVNGRAANFTPEEAARRGIVEMVEGDKVVEGYRLKVKGGAREGNAGPPRPTPPEQPLTFNLQPATAHLQPVTHHALVWIARQPADYAERKAQRLAPLLAQLDALGEEDIEHFLDQWFAPATRVAFESVWRRVAGRDA